MTRTPSIGWLATEGGDEPASLGQDGRPRHIQIDFLRSPGVAGWPATT
jgi:hypothetical protein